MINNIKNNFRKMGKKENINTNQTLIEGIRSGNEKIIINLYKELKPRVFKYVLYNSGNETEAEELIWDCIERFRQKCLDFNFSLQIPYLQYMYGVYRNTWLDRLKVKKKENIIIKVPGTQSTEEDNTFNPLNKLVVDLQDNQNFNELLEFVVDQINRLSELCQNIFSLICFDQKSHKDVSNELSIGENTSRKRLKDCRDKLRKSIHQQALFNEFKDEDLLLKFIS